MNILFRILFCTFALNFLISCVQTDTYDQEIEDEYRLSTSVPREHIRISPIRYKGERGKVFILIEIQPTDLSAMPGRNTVRMYNQTLRNIMQNECTLHFKDLNMGLGYVEYIEVQTKKFSNFSYKTWGRARCHGFQKNLDYSL